MKTQDDMRKWLEADRERSIRPLLHCSGWRVDLRYSYSEISTGVGATIEEAFSIALPGFESGIVRVLTRELRETKEQHERSIAISNESVRRVERALQAATARLAKPAA